MPPVQGIGAEVKRPDLTWGEILWLYLAITGIGIVADLIWIVIALAYKGATT